MPTSDTKPDIAERLHRMAKYLIRFRQDRLDWMEPFIDRMIAAAGGSGADPKSIPVDALFPVEDVAETGSGYDRAVGKLAGLTMWTCNPPGARGTVERLEIECRELAYARGLAKRIDAIQKASLAFAQVVQDKTTLAALIEAFWNFNDAVRDTVRYCRRLEKALQSKNGSDKAPVLVPEPTKPPMSKLAKALAVLVEHPDWTDDQVAKAASCNRKSLYRWPLYMKAKEAMEQGRKDLPRGHVTFSETRKRQIKSIEAYDGDGHLEAGGSWDGTGDN